MEFGIFGGLFLQFRKRRAVLGRVAMREAVGLSPATRRIHNVLFD